MKHRKRMKAKALAAHNRHATWQKLREFFHTHCCVTYEEVQYEIDRILSGETVLAGDLKGLVPRSTRSKRRC